MVVISKKLHLLPDNGFTDPARTVNIQQRISCLPLNQGSEEFDFRSTTNNKGL